MELLLNLAWLLLALPAYWLWRKSCSPAHRRYNSLQCLLALGCLLFILFPVVSATDDLRAMRTEMEESPVSKRSLCHKNSDKLSDSKWQSPPQLAVTANFSYYSEESWHATVPVSLTIPFAPAITTSCRAPPAPFRA